MSNHEAGTARTGLLAVLAALSASLILDPLRSRRSADLGYGVSFLMP